MVVKLVFVRSLKIYSAYFLIRILLLHRFDDYTEPSNYLQGKIVNEVLKIRLTRFFLFDGIRFVCVCVCVCVCLGLI